MSWTKQTAGGWKLSKRSDFQFLSGNIQDLAGSISNLSILFNAAIGKIPAQISPRYTATWKMPRPSTRDLKLRGVVFGLLRVAAEVRGEFTADSANPNSTLFVALRDLRLCLPKGSVPTALNHKTISKLKTEYSRIDHL